MGFSVDVTSYRGERGPAARLELPATDAEIEEFLIKSGLSDCAPEGLRVAAIDATDADVSLLLDEYRDVVTRARLGELSLLASVIDAFPDAAAQVSDVLEALGEEPASATDLSGWIVQADDMCFTPWDAPGYGESREEQLARAVIEEAGGIEEVVGRSFDDYVSYVDFGSFGRDLERFDGYVCDEHGFLDLSGFDGRRLDEGLYSREDLAELAVEGGATDDEAQDAIEEIESLPGFDAFHLDAAGDDVAWVAVRDMLTEDGTPIGGLGVPAYEHKAAAVAAWLREASCEDRPGPAVVASVAAQAEEIPYQLWDEADEMVSDAHERLGLRVASDDGIDIDSLTDYFDYEAFGRDLAHDYYITDGGYMHVGAAIAARPERYSASELAEIVGREVAMQKRIEASRETRVETGPRPHASVERTPAR